MPAFLQKLQMPSFWMSYVNVAQLDASLELAVELGAKCEVEPTSFDRHSRFALIRDPSGAGFTLFEGPSLNGRCDNGALGRMVWNELHVPNGSYVSGFYTKLYGWEIEPESESRYRILSQGKHIASVVVMDESVKGAKNYWAVYFSVCSCDQALQKVIDNGGHVLSASNNNQAALVCDDQGAAFFY